MLLSKYDNHELAEQIGLNLDTVNEYTRELKRADSAHICGWNCDPRGAETRRIFKLGPGEDAKPFRYTRKEVAAQRDARQKARKAQAALTFAPLASSVPVI